MKSQQIVKRAREILTEERRALDLTLAALDSRFAAAARMILGARGKVVVTGVGKSGLVGQKIAATLSSTGTTAVFMHGGDGIHGDLGVLKSEDVVLALSFSGSTIEILSNLPTIKKIGAKLVAMVGELDSPLAKAADVILPVVIRREACSMNLAPTSSTVAMMALGDALAVTLSELRGFRPEDFALYHPGGALGRKL
ncbi:SIS domain-containing protein, partial [Candidatus Sumerlaeota bacterium]|nr:SIS domain-containing protein [Candidatus Sumerlaeota bacterium]